MSLHGNLATEERLGHLVARLQAAGRIEIASAAADLGVSEMTIRRDLTELERRGEARRVRGGALPAGPMPFAARHRRGAKAKAVIATKLARLVPDTGAIALDASSTVMRLASAVTARDLVVITNGLDTFHALQGRAGVRALLTGGEVEPRTGSLVGPLACRAATQLAVSRFVLSAAALDTVLGATETVLEEAEVKRALASAADEVVLAVDSGKLDSRALAVSIELGGVDVLVTELKPTDRRLGAYREHVELV